ncbi:hypothetical protein MNBD_BACTEROID06-1523, partial [hydrothermal vent metagenome]
KLDAGIIRWPGGNTGNNYRWEEHLNKTGKLNLKNLIPFLDEYGLELQMVANFGNGSGIEAAEFVNFCNNQNNYYTELRNNLLNNPNPINVKYWEIGNEPTDAWSYGYSWLGFKDSTHFQSGVPSKVFTQGEADSLYYYGGTLFREGWIRLEGSGQLDKNTAILGDSKFYSDSKAMDTIAVEYPMLDTINSHAVRVYRTPNFDYSWGQHTATQQELYNVITNPNNLLSLAEFSWTPTEVMLSPVGGINSNDLILIEYNSINHDGAFVFRNLMKTADPSIEIGYAVNPDEHLASDTDFQQNFASSPPDFMIKHPYAGGLVIPLVEQSLFSEAGYVSEKKVSELVNFQQLWNQRKTDWGISNNIGLSISEWNVALFDNAPDTHAIRGITSGLYVADFWARTLEYALNDSLDLRTINHFALAAQGNNFIHLFHTNPTFSVGTEGKAATMVMESIGQGMFSVTLSNNPQIEVLTNNKLQIDTITIDAVTVWGGIGANQEYINLLLINKDDENAHTADIQFPNSWHVDKVIYQSLYGTMVDDTVFSSYVEQPFSENTYSVQIPPFSVNTIRLHLANPLNVMEDSSDDTYIYPNPGYDFVYLASEQKPNLVEIFNSLGKKVTHLTSINANKIEINKLKKGVYFIRVMYADKKGATFKLIKQ